MIVPILILGFILVVISGLVSARRKRNYPVPKRRVCDMSVTKEGGTSLFRPVDCCQRRSRKTDRSYLKAIRGYSCLLYYTLLVSRSVFLRHVGIEKSRDLIHRDFFKIVIQVTMAGVSYYQQLLVVSSQELESVFAEVT